MYTPIYQGDNAGPYQDTDYNKRVENIYEKRVRNGFHRDYRCHMLMCVISLYYQK